MPKGLSCQGCFYTLHFYICSVVHLPVIKFKKPWNAHHVCYVTLNFCLDTSHAPVLQIKHLGLVQQSLNTVPMDSHF